MDWTGGTRRRFAQGKRNAVVQKQKEHFAKVRSAQHEQLDWPEHAVGALASKQHRPTMTSSRPANTGSRASNSSRRSARHAPPTEALTRDRASALERTHEQRSSNVSRSIPADATDEERLLLANRQRLLARSDWLGLAASRPARIKFPTSSDRDRVGKRRKISKSKSRSHKGRPARRRSVTPLFEHRLPPFQPMMSGAMPEHEDEIRVKIGTDAFVSQSQLSHPAQPSENTSMRQPSTEFGPLSEESMLLGADDDGFEIDANGQYIGEIGRAKTIVSGSEQSHFHSKDQPTFGFATPTNSIAPTFATTNQGKDVLDDYGHVVDSAIQDHYTSLHGNKSTPSNEVHEHVDEYILERPEVPDHTKLRSLNVENTASSIIDPDEDERRWRRVMRIPEPAQVGNTSVAALKSSSQHVTESAISAWPVQQFGDQEDNHRMGASGSRRASDRDGKRSIPVNNTPRVHDTADGPMPLEAPCTQSKNDGIDPDRRVRDDEAIWKDFILGKRGSSDVDSSEHEHGVWAAEQDEAVQPAFQSTSSNVGMNQAQSDKVTVGDSTFAPIYTDDEVNDSPEANDEYQKYTTTSLVGHATTAGFEDDEIEEIDEVYPDDSVSRMVENTNVGRTMSTLNPRRFRRQKSQVSSQEPYNPRRFKVRAVEQSVW